MSRSSNGNIYVALTERGPVALREIRIPPGLDPRTLEQRRLRLDETVSRLEPVEHPNLARILGCFHEEGREYVVAELVEGATLATVVRWHPEPLSELQLIRWVMDIVQLLRWFLAECPGLSASRSLQMNHLVVTASGRLKLVNLGLGTLFDAELPDRAPDTEPMLLDCFQELAWALTRELGRKGPGTALTFLLNRRYETIERLEESFRQRLVALPEEREDIVLVRQQEFEIPLVVERVPGFWEVFLGQKPARIAAQVIPLLLVLLAVFSLLFSPPARRQGLAVYVAAGREILAIDPASRQIVSRVDAGGKVAAAARLEDSRLLFVALENDRRIRLLDTSTHGWAGELTDDAPPSFMIASDQLFAFHHDIPSVSVFRKKDERFLLLASFAVGRESRGLLVPGEVPVLAVSSMATDRVYLYDIPAARPVLSFHLEDPGALALSSDGTQLLVAQSGLDRIAVLDARTLKPRGKIWSTGGVEPMALVSEAEGIWCLNRSGSATLLDPATRKIVAMVKLPAPPGGWTLVSLAGRRELWVSIPSKKAVVVIDPESRSIAAELPVPAEPGMLVPIP